MSNQRNPNQANLVVAMVLAGLLLFGWPMLIHKLYPNAGMPQKPVAAAAVPGADGKVAPAGVDPKTLKPTREGGLSSAADQAIEASELAADLAPGARVPVAAGALSGSINLTGGVVDDLTLNRYKATLDKNSGPVRIFSPAGTIAQQYARVGWEPLAGQTANVALPNASTVWTVPAGARLTPQTPVVLSWSNATGQTFTLTYAIDDDYLITVKQVLVNKGPAAVAATPFGFILRTDRTASQRTYNIHSGPFGAFDDSVSFGPQYKDVVTAGQVNNAGKTDWLGFTDIYWMSVLVPDASAPGGATSDFRSIGGGLYLADLVYQPQTIQPGASGGLTTRLFAGAKEAPLLNRYEQAGIPQFSHAIDWGYFWFFERPIMALLRILFNTTGNFGVAIVLLTIVVRTVMFPVAQRQFGSMAAMRAIQPKMKALQARYKDDKAKLQEETMALYKAEGVNPLAGCLPVFLQIPVFFALYKVLMVSIEMRHQPFALWLHDLSAPDPLHFFNLFGLIHWDPPSILSLGPLGLLLGTTMFFQFKLQPAQPDPSQQQVMAIMPWMMMFIMSGFASGLLLYWITSNCLTMAQQAYLYSKHPGLKAQAAKDAADAKAAAARDKA